MFLSSSSSSFTSLFDSSHGQFDFIAYCIYMFIYTDRIQTEPNRIYSIHSYNNVNVRMKVSKKSK